MGRYSFSTRDLFEPFSGAAFAQFPGYGNNGAAPGSQCRDRRDAHLLARSDQRSAHRLQPPLAQRESTEPGHDVNAQVGLPHLWSNSRDNGLSYITVLGYSPLGDEYNNPQRGVTNTYQLTDQIIVARRAHLQVRRRSASWSRTPSATCSRAASSTSSASPAMRSSSLQGLPASAAARGSITRNTCARRATACSRNPRTRSAGSSPSLPAPATSTTPGGGSARSPTSTTCRPAA